MKRQLITMLCLLVLVTTTAPAIATELLPGPTLSATGNTLHWTEVSGSTSYRVYAKPEGETTHTETPVGNTLEYTPATDPGHTVAYKVKSNLTKWSNAITISYPAEEPPPQETWEGFTAFNPMPANRTVFASNSFINTPVAEKPEVLPNSAEMVAFIGKPQDLWTDGGGDHPWYYAKESDPIDEVTCSNPCYEEWVKGLKLHIPSVAKPSVGSDHHMGVVERNGESYNFWSVQKEGPKEGKLEVHGAGWSSNLGTGSGVSEKQGGATASGFNTETGVIRPEEWAAGHINHGLITPVHVTKKSCVLPPATGTDGTSSEPNAPCQGQHLYLDESVTEIEASTCAEAKETLLIAMHQFGIWVDDSGGNQWGLKLQGQQSYSAYGLANPFNTFLDKEPEITKETGAGGPSDTLKIEGCWELSRLRAIK